MSRTLKLLLAYDGTGFHGWQAQPNLRTVQAEMQAVVQRILRHPCAVVGASRTDSGVHARGQVAHLETTSVIPLQNFQRATACRLPSDLSLLRVEEAPDGFHAIRDARGKLYRYRIWNAVRRPVGFRAAPYCWHVWHPLELERMQAAAAILVGRHDFTSFANPHQTRESCVRTLRRLDLTRRYEEIWIDAEGEGFLYHQMRIMVGTLYEIGRGHWPVARAAEILAARDRAQAGPTAPAQGLCLQWVRYDASRAVTYGA